MVRNIIGVLLVIMYGKISICFPCTFEEKCNCQREGSKHLLFADCGDRNLARIPSEIPNTVEHLKLAGNKITVVNRGAFLTNNKLLYLDLSRNNIVILYSDSFKGLFRLKNLSLEKNNLSYETISYRNVFEPLRNIKILNIKGNIDKPSLISIPYLRRLTSLKMDVIANSEARFNRNFTHLTRLVDLDLSGVTGNCIMKTLTSKTFEVFPNIKHLDLSKCHIGKILSKTFQMLTKLTTLDLSDNRCLEFRAIINVTSGLNFTSIQTLKINRIRQTFALSAEIKKCHLENLQNTKLREIYIDGNRLQKLESQALHFLPKSLKFVSAADNVFSFGNYLFDVYAMTVQTLDISLQVKTHEIKDEEECDAYLLEHKLCDSYVTPENHISEINFLFKETVPFPFQLKKIIFRLCKMRIPIPNINLSNNQLQYLDASYNTLYEWQGPLVNVLNLTYLDLSYNFCLNISRDFFSGAPNIQELYIEGNLLCFVLPSDVDGNILAPLKKLEILKLGQNRIPTLPTNVFKTQTKLTRLDIGNNLLEKIEVDISRMDYLTFLNISFNMLSELDTSFTTKLDGLFNKNRNLSIDLTGNPLKCNCDSLDFIKWISTTSVHLHNIHKYHCFSSKQTVRNLDNLKLLYKGLVKECSSYTGLIAGLVLWIFVSILVVVCGLAYRFRWKLRYLYFVVKNKYHRNIKPEKGEERSYEYDAFISYANEDGLFVHKKFIQNVEETAGFKCCIHKRDFLPGNSIASNIISAIHNSRKTIVVMSRSYLKSGWCEYEYNMAKMESIYSRKRENIMILIFVEQISTSDLPLTILELVQAQSYVEYPNDEYGDVVFWEKVRQSISS